MSETTAIIGVGNIGGAVARQLVTGGESVVLAAKEESSAHALVATLGPLARAASVEDAIDDPIAFDASGEMSRTLPERQSAGSVVAALLPAGAHHVKAFGTFGADALAGSAYAQPRSRRRAATSTSSTPTVSSTTSIKRAPPSPRRRWHERNQPQPQPTL